MLVGLANPGPEYAKTRHNAGAWFIEELAKRYNCILKHDSKHHGLVGKVIIQNQEFKLLIPTTFMNLSGKAVSSLANFYKIPVENILVAHDEMDLEPGIAKLKKGGGHGGHNGLKDIIKTVGKDFIRLRFGIGHPAIKADTNAWVIKKPSPEEKKLINDSFDKAIFALDDILNLEWLLAMNKLHSK